LVEFSIEDDDVPETKAKRADIGVLFWLKRISDTETEVVNMIHVYLKGKLPGIAKNMIPKKHLSEFQSLRKLAES